MARRAIDIRRFAGDLRSHFTALLSDSRSGKIALEQFDTDGAPWGVMAAFDNALAKTLLDAFVGTPETRPGAAAGPGKKAARRARKVQAGAAAAAGLAGKPAVDRAAAETPERQAANA